MLSKFKKMLGLLDRKNRIYSGLLALAILAGALLEIASIALVYPFIALITDPTAALRQLSLQWVKAHLAADLDPHAFTIAFGFALLVLAVIKNLYALWLYDRQFRFIFRNQEAVGTRLLASYLSKPYLFHVQHNSALLLRNLSTEMQNLFNNIFIPSFYLVTDIALVSAVVVLLFVVQPHAALALAVLLGGVAVGFDLITRRRVKRFGESYLQSTGQMMQWANQGLGGIKEIKLLGREQAFLINYGRHAAEYSHAARVYHTMYQVPRLLTEAVTIIGMVVVALVMLLSGTPMQAVLPAIGMFALAGLRLMPTLNRINFSLTSLRFFTPALDAIAADLLMLGPSPLLPRQSSPALIFARELRVAGVSFTYPTAALPALHEVELTIPRGSVAAFVGPSGSGKSTLVDVIMGLLAPQSGQVLVDGRDIATMTGSWQRLLGYIPQSLYLIDDTIRRNVGFGLPDDGIDENAVWAALEAAQLKAFVAGLPEGLDTRVGERGVCLSGGQRQRIVIARALYGAPQVLVFDEATSSLDPETELEVTRAIQRLAGERTILVISHRPDSIQGADQVFQVVDGRVNLWGAPLTTEPVGGSQGRSGS